VPGRVQLRRRRTAEPPPHVEHNSTRRHDPKSSDEVVGIYQLIAGVHYVILADAACAPRTRLLGVVPLSEESEDS
jgi:hypothetical protein